mgnify:CR=1 FL=1
MHKNISKIIPSARKNSLPLSCPLGRNLTSSGKSPLISTNSIIPRAAHLNTYWGISSAIDLYKCDPVKIRSKESLKNYIDELCHLIKMEKYGDTYIQHFGESEEVSGYSLVQLITTSCITGHFANKSNSAYLDIFSCRKFDPRLAANFTAKFFDSKSYDFSTICRGSRIKD